MSVLSPDIHKALNQLLHGLQSSDNVVRAQAEETLNNEWVNPRPDVLLMGLVEQIQAADDNNVGGTYTFTTSSGRIFETDKHQIRSYAAVLFRRIATRTRKDPTTDVTKDLFLTLPQPERDAIRQKLLDCLTAEATPAVRNKTSDAVAEIARQYTEEGEQWPGLLERLFNLSQSQDATQRESAFRIFMQTPGIIEKQHEEVVLTVFTKGFKDNDIAVRLGAIEAFSSFFRSINKKSQKKYFALISDILNILPPLKEAGDSEQLSGALTALTTLADVAPRMFQPLFNNLVEFSISVIQDKELADLARQNALELMATFADQAPAMCKKDPSYTSQMVTQCLSLMTDVGMDDDDAAEWNASEDLDVDDSDMNHVAGEQCMDRLANNLKGEALLPPTFNWLPRMMASSAWRDRHAALMAISAISEGCRDLMVSELDKVLDLVLPALRDPHPRVRWAGCNALGQMSTDFAGPMQEKYHDVVLPNIIPVLESPEPRVQAHAAAALVNFCEEAEKEILEPYLDNLLQHLLRLLQSDKRFVQEQALSTIATVADSAESAFGRYYGTLMPLLFRVLQQEQSKEYRLLRAKAMECATLIALAVGKERMGADAITLVNILGQIQNSITDDDDPQASYLLHCWGRMCRVLGQDFLPYLQTVMGPLMKLAGAKADIQLLDDEEQVGRIEGDENWELVPLKGKRPQQEQSVHEGSDHETSEQEHSDQEDSDQEDSDQEDSQVERRAQEISAKKKFTAKRLQNAGKVIGIKTSVLDDKNMAIELIVIYAQVLQGAFEPYVNDIIDNIALPGLAFFFHDPVRIASAKCVPQLLNCYKKAHGPESTQLGQLWERTVEKVLEVLSTEPAIDTLAEMYQCFYECVEVIGKNCLTPAHMAAFIEAAKGVLEEYQHRVKERQEEAAEKDEGEEESEETLFAIEDDQTLLSDMNKAFHTVFKNMGTAFLPFWERLINVYDAAAQSTDATQRQWAICIFDDVLEFCGPTSWNYSNHIIQPLVNGMQDTTPANCQAAIYGVGMAAHKGGPQWSEFVSASLPTLFAVTQRPNAREEDDVYATENACAAIAKILNFCSDKVPNVQEVIRAWIDTLPVVNDEEAAPYAYAFLGHLIEQ